MQRTIVLLMILFAPACQMLNAQSTQGQEIAAIPASYLDKISKKSDALNNEIDKKTVQMLSSLKKQQKKLKQKLYKIDSIAANNIFTSADQKIKELEQRIANPQKVTQYIPFLDTLKTSLKFLDKNNEYLSKVKDASGKLGGALDKVNGLESKLQQAEQVKQFLKQQKQLLKTQLEKFGFAKQLKKLNKDVYYYSQQINEYKEIIKDKTKIERKAIELLGKAKLFQDFMKKNSMLASLFSIPADDPNHPAYLQSLAGLQTRTQVSNLIQNQVAAGGPGARQQILNNIQQAQGQLRQLKEKLLKASPLASGGDLEGADMPDFKPNNQKTKSFLRRIEYGTNSQSTRSNGLLPVTSDIGLSVGYKLNDKSIIGIGSSYKLGWGKDIRHIKLSHEGVGLRSFIDYKLKAMSWKILEGFWISGGFEMNYQPTLKDAAIPSPLRGGRKGADWQQSGLLGLTKKLPINLKFFKNTRIQLLWDFMSYGQLPRTQPLLFRVGYNL